MPGGAIARAGLVLMGLLALHIVDHAAVQPSREVPALGGLVGLAGFTVIAISVILAVREHPRAAEFAVFAGLSTVAGFIVVHLVPDFHPLADPYWDFDAGLFTWAAIVAPMVMGAVLAAAGFRELEPRASAEGAA